MEVVGPLCTSSALLVGPLCTSSALLVGPLCTCTSVVTNASSGRPGDMDLTGL